MKYLNQLEHADMPYATNIEDPESKFVKEGTVALAGCGLCSLCMVVDRLCLESFSLEDCREMAVAVGANRKAGTDLKLLAPAVADKFDLDLEMTDDPEPLKKCLREGGAAVVHVGGDREGHIGVFSHGGHYIVAVSLRGDEFCILDPSMKEGKYDEEGRRGKVRQSGAWVYTDEKTLQEDSFNRSPGYYLFRRKSDLAK